MLNSPAGRPDPAEPAVLGDPLPGALLLGDPLLRGDLWSRAAETLLADVRPGWPA